MAANATFALKPGVWFLRVRFVIFAPDSRREPSPPSGRKSTQPTVQILEASSERPACFPSRVSRNLTASPAFPLLMKEGEGRGLNRAAGGIDEPGSIHADLEASHGKNSPSKSQNHR